MAVGDDLLRDGFDGVPVERPGDEDEVAAALRTASEAGEAVVLRGGGTRMDLGRPPSRVDRVVDLGRLEGIIEHHVGDLTVEAWAGTTVAALNAALAPSGQFAALDPPLPERATLGGVIAAGEPGIRTVPGARPRDVVLGLTAVLSDGTRIRSGGRVVKNVTGYELNKLFTGSLGTLGAITRVTLRLRAIPEASRTEVFRLQVEDSADAFADRVLAAVGAAPGPAAAAVVPPGTGSPGLPEDGGFRLAVRFEGLREEAEVPSDGVADAVGAAGEVLEDGSAREFWDGVRDGVLSVPRSTAALGVSVRGPAAAVLRTAWRLAATGPAFAFPDQRRAVASVPPDAFEAARDRIEPGVALAVESAPAGWKSGGEVFWPPPPAALEALNARLKRALDPRGVLAPGRLAGAGATMEAAS